MARGSGSRTALMLAAGGGKPRALKELLEAVRYSNAIDRGEMLEASDDDGRTALMHAAYAPHLECAVLLREAGASETAKCERGKTARAYAEAAKNAPGKRAEAQRVVDLFDGKYDEEEEEEEEEEDVPDDGLTSTQRSKLKKKMLLEKEGKGAVKAGGAKKDKEEDGGVAGDDQAAADGGADAAAPAAPAAEPVWDEVAEALSTGKKEISCVRDADDALPVDPALWRCTAANRLVLQCGLRGDGGVLAGMATLSSLTTLVLSDNALEGLPGAALKELKALKTLECENNALTCFPDETRKLKSLEVLRCGRNKLASLAPLSKLTNLVVLDASFNSLAAMDMDLTNKGRLQTLALKGNKLESLPEEMGSLEALAALNVSDNQLKALPASMGGLGKKLKEVTCDGNPFEDPKLRKLVGGKIKDLLNYCQKLGGGKKGKGKKK